MLGLALGAGSIACAVVAGLEDKEAYPTESEAAIGDGAVPDGRSMPVDSGPVGVPQVFAKGQAKPWGVAVDDGFVYWTNEGDSTVMRAPKSGGAPAMIAHDQLEPHRILVDGTHVIWHNTNLANHPLVDGGPDLLEIVDLPKSAIGTDAGLVKIQTTKVVSRLRDLAMTKAPDDQLWTAYDTRVTRYHRSSPQAARDVSRGLLAKQPSAVAVDDVNVYWFLQQPFEVWANTKNFDDGGADAGILIATLPGSPEIGDMVVDGTALYMVSTGGALLKVPMAGDGGSVQLATGHSFPKAIVQDDKYVYFTRSSGDDAAGQGVVVMVSKAGDETKIVAQGLDKPRGLALDVASDGAHVVYWANYGDGTIRRTRVR